MKIEEVIFAMIKRQSRRGSIEYRKSLRWSYNSTKNAMWTLMYCMTAAKDVFTIDWQLAACDSGCSNLYRQREEGESTTKNRKRRLKCSNKHDRIINEP